jgi:hypothetical protein
MPADPLQLESLFESLEAGAGAKLRTFLKEAKKKYDIGMGEICLTSRLYPSRIYGLAFNQKICSVLICFNL